MDEDGDSSGPRKGKEKKKSSGDRCMVMNCSSTYQSATVYRMPGPMPAERARFSPLQMAWIHFIQRNRVFDHSKSKHIHVCSMHFDESQYDQTQLRMCKMGLRKRPPQLLPNSIPHIYNPVGVCPDSGLSGASVPGVAVVMVEDDVEVPPPVAAAGSSHATSTTQAVTSSSPSSSSTVVASGSSFSCRYRSRSTSRPTRNRKQARASYFREKVGILIDR